MQPVECIVLQNNKGGQVNTQTSHLATKNIIIYRKSFMKFKLQAIDNLLDKYALQFL